MLIRWLLVLSLSNMVAEILFSELKNIKTDYCNHLEHPTVASLLRRNYKMKRADTVAISMNFESSNAKEAKNCEVQCYLSRGSLERVPVQRLSGFSCSSLIFVFGTLHVFSTSKNLTCSVLTLLKWLGYIRPRSNYYCDRYIVKSRFTGV
jgi:hypothetical protein